MKTLFGLFLFFVSTTTFASIVFVTDPEIQEKLKEAGIKSVLVKTSYSPKEMFESGGVRTPISLARGTEFYMQIEDIFVGQMERNEVNLAVKRWSLIKAMDHLFAVSVTADPYTLSYLNFQNGRQTDVYLYSPEKQAIVLRNGINGLRTDLGATCRANGPEWHSKNVIEMPCDDVRNLEFYSPQMIDLLIKGIRQLKAQQIGSLE